MISEQILNTREAAALQQRDPALLLDGKVELGELTLDVDPKRILEACEALRAAGYNQLSNITAADWFPTEPRFRVVYHLHDLAGHTRVRLAVRAGEENELESVVGIWPAANWYEREVWDMFGVRFTGHPMLRRILLPDDWEGHPLRKDFPTEGIR